MADNKDKPDDGSEFPHRFSEGQSQRMIESAYISEEVRAQASYITVKALGDLSPVCETCGDICDEHAIKLRDAFFKRAAFLADRLWKGLDLYLQQREFGVSEPVDIINSIYRLWSELSCLHDLVEPNAKEEDDLADEENVQEE
jgi:hypothetical protein